MIINSNFYRIPQANSALDIPADTRLIVLTSDLTKKDSELLSKIIQSTKLASSQIMSVNISEEVFAYKSIQTSHLPLKLICFGISPDAISLQIESIKYKALSIMGHEVVFVDSINVIGSEVPLKKYIWNLLKNWFIYE